MKNSDRDSTSTMPTTRSSSPATELPAEERPPPALIGVDGPAVVAGADPIERDELEKRGERRLAE